MCQNGGHPLCARCGDERVHAGVRFKDSGGTLSKAFCWSCANILKRAADRCEEVQCERCGGALTPDRIAECGSESVPLCLTCKATRTLQLFDPVKVGAIAQAEFRYHGDGGCDDQAPHNAGQYSLERALERVH